MGRKEAPVEQEERKPIKLALFLEDLQAERRETMEIFKKCSPTAHEIYPAAFRLQCQLLANNVDVNAVLSPDQQDHLARVLESAVELVHVTLTDCVVRVNPKRVKTAAKYIKSLGKI